MRQLLSGRGQLCGVVCAVVISLYLYGCSNEMNNPTMSGSLSGIQAPTLAKHGLTSSSQVNLVANLASYSARKIDVNLANAWGIAFTPTGKIWISANHSGLSVIYDTSGTTQRTPVIIPSEDSSGGGAPSGVVFNSTTGFVIPATGEISKFIFSSEDGIISAWSSGSNALNVADRSSSGTVYKGLALAFNNGQPYLYATDFRNGKVDVLDIHFHYVSSISLKDPGIPSGYAPFGIQNIDGFLFVTYAKQKGPDNMDDQAGPGFGYVDVYRPGGKLVSRFASQGALNSPWGIAKAPDGGFGKFGDAILIGNFGDGRINAFSEYGKFLGPVSDSAGNPIAIEGLWGLSFGNQNNGSGYSVMDDGHDGGNDNHDGGSMRSLPLKLYFTAGPNDESDGLFGYITSSVNFHK